MDKINTLLGIISKLTGWEYNKEYWLLTNLTKYEFDKYTINALNNNIYKRILSLNPISFAVTATKRIEYTIGRLW